MPNLPVAVKFFLNQRKIVVVAALRSPDPGRLKVLRTANMIATPPESTPRSVYEGRARLLDTGAPAYKLMIAVFRYTTADGLESDEEILEPDDVLGTSARLEITIKNEPDGEVGAAFQDLAIVVEDPEPSMAGSPPIDGPINLYA